MQRKFFHYAADLSMGDRLWHEPTMKTSAGRRMGMIIVLFAALGTAGALALAVL